MTSTTPILVTGAAGFIGMHVCERLLQQGEAVIGVDSFTTYYNTHLKEARAALLGQHQGFQLHRLDINDKAQLPALVAHNKVKRIVHLAAQAGVRYSIDNPHAYQHANLDGHLSMLELARANEVDHFVYASSSSVYGNRPLNADGFREDDPTDEPVSLYAATKKSNELISESYRNLYGFPQTGLRFFTVYGPWGRPDMAYFKFAEAIALGQAIEVYGNGQMARDFTYIDDIVDGIVGVLHSAPGTGEHKIYNIGNNTPVGLTDMITTLENALGQQAEKIMRPMQPGDVVSTFANIDQLNAAIGYKPTTSLDVGLEKFARWWREYRKA